jgi:hypothetical protein
MTLRNTILENEKLLRTAKRFAPENYRIVVHSKAVNGRVYLSAVNFDFGIEHHEEVTRFSETERILSMAHLIIGIQKKITERLKGLDRQTLPHPVPMNADEVLKPKIPDTLSIGEVAKVLGEKIHNVRRMANLGLIPSKLSHGGHRRFPKDATLRLAKERVASEF